MEYLISLTFTIKNQNMKSFRQANLDWTKLENIQPNI